jgi:16S rRNA (uracil1498-N3)-methyltransferase
MARRRFFVDEVRNQQAQLVGDDAHHLTRVLRVERGQVYEISDNRDVYLATVTEAHKGRVVFSVNERVPAKPRPVHITLFVALIKFDRMEWIFEKGAELGAERFVPVIAQRTEKGLDRAAQKRIERWRRILVESSQQARRDAVPEIGEPMRFADAIATAADVRLFADEAPEAAAMLNALPESPCFGAHAAAFVGPEGGWTEPERAAAVGAGWTPVSLGDQILRAETAALAMTALLQAHWGAHAPGSR